MDDLYYFPSRVSFAADGLLLGLMLSAVAVVRPGGVSAHLERELHDVKQSHEEKERGGGDDGCARTPQSLGNRCHDDFVFFWVSSSQGDVSTTVAASSKSSDLSRALYKTFAH